MVLKAMLTQDLLFWSFQATSWRSKNLVYGFLAFSPAYVKDTIVLFINDRMAFSLSRLLSLWFHPISFTVNSIVALPRLLKFNFDRVC